MRMIDCLHATPKIEERANNIAIVCATVPDPTTILLSLNGAEELVARIGRVRETMQPAVPDKLPLGGVIELVHTHDMGAWPDHLSGKLVLSIRDPRFGWHHYGLTRDKALELSDAIRKEAEKPINPLPEA